VSIEAVGYPETLLTAAALVRPGGTIANIGVHGVPVELPMQEMWIQNASGRIPAGKMGTHAVHLRADPRGV
jgi:alcohol dehydrogenase